MEATVQTHRRLRLRQLSVVSMSAVGQVAGLTLDGVPGWILALTGGHGRPKPTPLGAREPLWGARLGRVAAGARRLAAGGLHDSTDVVVQDALGVLLMSVSHERTAVINVGRAGVVML